MSRYLVDPKTGAVSIKKEPGSNRVLSLNARVAQLEVQVRDQNRKIAHLEELVRCLSGNAQSVAKQ